MKEFKYVVTDNEGIHARPAGELVKLVKGFESTISIEKEGLLFTHHYPARCFGMNMPKSRDIQAKISLPQAIWNEFWLRHCERSEQ